MKVKLYPKQRKALRILLNMRNGIEELLFGGAAGGGKSIIGCMFIIIMALKFPGTRYFIGRLRLKTLKESTLNSFFMVCRWWGLKEGVHYRYNSNESYIHFIETDSRVLLIDLFAFPTDPDFDRFGSVEFTAGFVDEANQASTKAIEVIKTRLRYRLKDYCDKCGELTEGAEVLKYDENDEPEVFRCKNPKCGCATEGLIPKMVMTCNPAKNHVYNNFYKPFRDGLLAAFRAFIPSKSGDNPGLSKHYVTLLDRLTGQMRARLKEGRWETSDPFAIFDTDKTFEFLNTERRVEDPGYFMSVDPSGTGDDDAEIVVMSKDLVIVEWLTLEGQLEQSDIEREMDKLIAFYSINEEDIAIDTDGLGHGLRTAYPNAQHIHNNGTALFGEQKDYANIKTQLYFYLAKIIKEGALAMNCWTPEIEERLTQELNVIQQVQIDKDGPRQITSKKDIKAAIGRSPNKADALAYMMRHVIDSDNGETWIY